MLKNKNSKRLPVTLLSGFLGAGKTTLLNKILNSNHNLRIAVIVNDMSEVNIDSELISSQSVMHTDSKIIEMHNGCICCTLREDLLVEVEKLANTYSFDYLIIESTGISEPLPVAETFTFALPDGSSLSNLAYLDTLVTIVDGANFLLQYKQAELLDDQNGNKDKTIADLLIEQIEFANILLISKIDLISSLQLSELISILKALNSRAKIIPMLDGNAPFNALINTEMYSLADAQQAPGWLSVLRGEASSEAEEYKIDSYVWQSRRPLHPQRFANFLNSKWEYGKLLRSKGFFWLATQLESICLWNQAGGIMRYQYAGQWWAFTPTENLPSNIDVRQWILQRWDEHVGDCRQEIVFIGQNLLKEKLARDLDNCLLTDREFSDGPVIWQTYQDQFPLWASPKAELPSISNLGKIKSQLARPQNRETTLA